ncbi:MAG: DUF4392 domain-containing protein, partial [Candidatus Babeliales bacterium]
MFRNHFLFRILSLSLCLSCPCSALCSEALSQKTFRKIAALEKIIHHDPGNRGIQNLFRPEDIKTATERLRTSKHVAIVTGFFIPGVNQPETDGPLGAFALARALVACNKKVTIITDAFCKPAIEACHHALTTSFHHPVCLAYFPTDKQQQYDFIHRIMTLADCLLSIERVGRTHDGTYRTMRGIDITSQTAPLDELFIAGRKQKITTIGIGDGGNEIGMGKMIKEVSKYVPMGNQIGCIVPVDNLIVAGVSNWGGYALAGALCCVLREQHPATLNLDACFSSNQEQKAMLASMVSYGCCDGVSLTSSLSIDGLDWDVHHDILD